MAPVPAASGNHINWINYKTGVKYLHVRMKAEGNFASIAFEITHPDALVRQLYFEQLQQMQMMLENYKDWDWNNNEVSLEGKPFCSLSIQLENVQVYNTEDWPKIISFLKPKLLALDSFWYIAKDVFEIL